MTERQPETQLFLVEVPHAATDAGSSADLILATTGWPYLRCSRQHRMEKVSHRFGE